MTASSTVDDDYLAPFPSPCPSWCRVGTAGVKHVRHLEYPAGLRPQERVHEGPTFGAVQLEASEYLDAPGVLHVRSRVSTGFRDKGAGDLRQLAADALAAAEWLEAHR